MNFNEWWKKNYPDGAGYSIAELAWNAAVDAAVRILEDEDIEGASTRADAVRLLKRKD